MAALLTASMNSSCLLGKRPEFDETGLPPITPPTILETAESSPLPNAFVEIQLTNTTASVVLPIIARVLEPNPTLPQPLEARIFIDRPRPCMGSTTTCTSVTVPRIRATSDAGSQLWEISQLITFANPGTTGTCHTVDLYVSSAFQALSMGQEHYTEPVRPGDIAHARWFVYLRPEHDTNPADAITGCSTVVMLSNGVGANTESPNTMR